MRVSAKLLGVVLLLSLISGFLIWDAALEEDHRGTLTVSFLDVGAGDAIFVGTPSGRQVLIDGGSDDSVLRRLGDVMSFYDRSIDIVVARAATADTVGGLTSVLSRYTVSAVIESGTRSGAPQVQAFDGALTNAQTQGTRLITFARGEVVDLGEGTYIEAFFPDRSASNLSPSDGCLVLKLLFGNTAFLFSCGSTAIENYLATLDGERLKSNVLLATGNDSELFVGFALPQFAITPCNSSTSSSVFSKLGIQTFDTCDGAVTFVSDGQTVTRQ